MEMFAQQVPKSCVLANIELSHSVRVISLSQKYIILSELSYSLCQSYLILSELSHFVRVISLSELYHFVRVISLTLSELSHFVRVILHCQSYLTWSELSHFVPTLYNAGCEPASVP